jgi:hypothetical protein
MWRKLKNIFLSFKSYHLLSPDLRMRRRVNRALRDRPTLTVDEWFESFWQPQGISKDVACFVYIQLEKYSGLKFGRVLPSDRLHEDLQWTSVCWFDWDLMLYKDFWHRFGIDISDDYEFDTLCTVEELMTFLNRQLLLVQSS